MARKEIRCLFKEGTVIHCKTYEEDSKVRYILQSYAFKWADTSSMSCSFWNEYKERTCIDPFECRFTNIDYYKRNGYNIISADEFVKVVESNN